MLHRLFVPNPKDWAVVELPRWLAPAYYVLRPFRLLRATLSRRAAGAGNGVSHRRVVVCARDQH